MEHTHNQPPGRLPGGFSLNVLAPAATAVDPVCGMTVDTAHAAGSSEFEGRTYYFCGPHCLARFRASPRAYLEKPSQPAPCPSGVCGTAPVEYFCPMHPEVVSDHPGSCPKCGM